VHHFDAEAGAFSSHFEEKKMTLLEKLQELFDSLILAMEIFIP
jgi:hypothetical protein